MNEKIEERKETIAVIHAGLIKGVASARNRHALDEIQERHIDEYVRDAIDETKRLVLESVLEEIGKMKNQLPLELKYCTMEVHRKQQDMAPFLNDFRNGVLTDLETIIQEMMK